MTLLWHWPFGLQHLAWVELLLLLNVLVLARIALLSDGGSRSLRWEAWYLLAATAFGIAYWLPQGWLAAIWLTPWLLFAILENARVWQAHPRPFQALKLLQKSAYLFWLVGIAWAFADRLGWRPLDFSPTIVLLTAVHFHYAGLLLPLIASWAVAQQPDSRNNLISFALMLGIPLVALGITATRLGLPTWLETFAATWMGGTGLIVALIHLPLALSQKPLWIKLLLYSGVLCLSIAMLLAIAYGWNSILGWHWLTIPWMYAVHGSLNAFGVGIALLGAWFWIKKAP